MLTPFDHLLAVTLAVLFPLRAGSVLRGRLASASEADLPAVRRATYRNAMLLQWTLSAAVCALWIVLRRPWRGLGLVPVWSAGLIGILFGLALVVVVVLRQLSRGALDERAAESLRKRTVKLERMMPRSRQDLSGFYRLSITAGVCEEVLYRGFFIWYLQRIGLALIPAAIGSSLVFGFGHLYQGPRGMLQTAAVGGFLAAVYLLSGSLLAGILIHALMDMYSGRILFAAYSRAPAPVAPAEVPT